MFRVESHETLYQFPALFFQYPYFYFNSGVFQLLDSPSRYERERVNTSDNDPWNPLPDNQVGARGRFPVMRARFQTDVDGGFFQQAFVFDRGDGVHFRMAFAAADMIAFADNASVADYYGSYGRVGSRVAESVFCQLDAAEDIFFVVCHIRSVFIVTFAGSFQPLADGGKRPRLLIANALAFYRKRRDIFRKDAPHPDVSANIVMLMHPIYSYIKETLQPFYPQQEASALAKWILTDVFLFSAAELYAGKDINFRQKDRDRLEDILARLKKYEPMQYILGECTFCGLSFKVAPGVLIPRPETAELVEWITADCSGREVSVLDVGTGSGCIAVALACRLENSSVTAWDISEDALRVARENAGRNGADIDFRRVDVLGDVPAMQADVLVSNPPYVTEKERAEMEPNVLDWEPGLALFVPDNDPLLFYRTIARKGLELLKSNGKIYFEINRAYGKETVELLERSGYQKIELKKDSFGNDRMIKATRR